MLPFNQNPPRITASITNPSPNALSYQFCFLNRPFVDESNAKDVYYKLLIWPKAEKIIDHFAFLIKINHEGILKPLEFLEFPILADEQFDPFGDQCLVVKIPEAFYQTKLQFAFSFSDFDEENQGQIQIDLSWFNPHQIDDILIFYDTKKEQSTNLLTWDLDTYLPEITFNQTYSELLTLTANLTDLTFEITDYESVNKLRFLALLEPQQPELKKITIGNLATKNPYLFEPHFNWQRHENLTQTIYQLELTNQLALIGDQIQEVSTGDPGFKANPFVTNNQGLTLNLTFLNHEFIWTNAIKQASLQLVETWDGDYFEV